jgi:type I restriction enzyme M protein
MLDSVTKKRIDDLRNILVGKIPSPQSQVEQITTGLIYKFMYDMDVDAVEMGGVPSFFINDYEKYSWKHLFDPKLGGADKVQLYSDAIENMYTNPSAPQLFREIFKNSFLPFKDPSTLNMFLKEINEFHYSHSEKLGDAFEYLLSFMGSQGDAGQFRTPRHIIDFIVEIINPQKNETILDPACGTAGFLISSYKHILSQNTDKKLGDKLNASDRKQVGDNLVGYDISPDMTRISLVNMYLHQFASPQIHEYDTLSSEDRWNEYYDVILANPPFFSPTGGIQPHSRFGVQSTRAEVLFVDYIMEHLKPTGRAGIVVPEGIIFQTGTAYKTLRKKLVEDCLVGVISLPAGVFQPYSGVKTSILILDKELNQKSDSIFFAKVENDGFSLGAQRTPTSKNDLPEVVSQIVAFGEGKDCDLQLATKEDVFTNRDVSLNGSAYKITELTNSNYEMVNLGNKDLFEVLSGGTPKSTEETYWNGDVNWISLVDLPASNLVTQIRNSERTITELGLKNSSAKMIPVNSVIVSTRATIGRVGINRIPLSTNQGFKNIVIKDDSRISCKYIAYMMTNLTDQMIDLASGGTFKEISKTNFETLSIPLPPIEVQQQIVDELEGYQKIIDGCRQVVENYKPTIDIDPSWEVVELGELVSFSQLGLVIPAKEQSDDKDSLHQFPYFKMNNITYEGDEIYDKTVFVDASSEEVSKYSLVHGDFLFNTRNTPELVGKCCVVAEPKPTMLFNNNILRLRFSDRVRSEFVSLILNTQLYKKELFRFVNATTSVAAIYQKNLFSITIPLPSIDLQNTLVDSVLLEKNLVGSNRQLIQIYTQKIQDRIRKVWGE